MSILFPGTISCGSSIEQSDEKIITDLKNNHNITIVEGSTGWHVDQEYQGKSRRLNREHLTWHEWWHILGSDEFRFSSKQASIAAAVRLAEGKKFKVGDYVVSRNVEKTACLSHGEVIRIPKNGEVGFGCIEIFNTNRRYFGPATDFVKTKFRPGDHVRRKYLKIYHGIVKDISMGRTEPFYKFEDHSLNTEGNLELYRETWDRLVSNTLEYVTQTLKNTFG